MNTTCGLSVCMIVKNEENILDRCLQSIVNVADQIIIVDTGSEDNTVSIAQKFTKDIISFPWQNDFSLARNKSIQNARYSWILWLDADDIVPKESIDKIGELKKSPADRIYNFIVRNQKPGNTGSEFLQARMFPNHPKLHFERKIHEQITPSALRIGMKIEQTDIVVEHHGYADPELLKKKAQRNLNILLDEYNEIGPDPVMAVEIGDSFRLLSNFTKAIEWYEAVLNCQNCKEAYPSIASQAYLGLGTILNEQKLYTQAIDAFTNGLQCTPDRADMLYGLAVSYDLLKKTDKAVEILNKICEIKPTTLIVGVDIRAAKLKSYLRLIRILTECNKLLDVEICISNAINNFPNRPEIFNMAGKSLCKFGKLIDAIKLFEKSLQIVKENNLDAYTGLCLIYKIAGRKDVIENTLKSMEPFFSSSIRYWAIRELFLKENITSPLGLSSLILQEEAPKINQEYFGLLNV